MNLDNWSLSRKLHLNFVLFLICFLLVVVISLVGFKQVKEQFNEVAQDSVPDIVAILELKSLSKRLFAEIQGFVATGDRDEIEEFEETYELFDQWYEKWTVDQSDELELGFKLAMLEHKNKFNEFAQSVYELEFEKSRLLEEYSRYQEKIEEETKEHGDEIEHQLHDYLSHLYRHVYNAILLDSGEEEDEESREESTPTSVFENNKHKETTQEELITLINELTPQLASAELVSLVEKLIAIGNQLVFLNSEIHEVLESIEDYEEDILETLDKAVALQTTEVQQAFSTASYSVNLFVVYISIIGTICIVLSLFVFRYIAQSITTRVERLVATVLEVTNGNLEARAQIDGLDELGLLGRNFDAMTQTLSETTVSKEYLDNLLRNMSESLVVTSEVGVIQIVNNATLKLLEYEREELVGQNILILFDDSVLPTTTEGDYTETQFLTKSGMCIDIQLSSSRLLSRSDKGSDIVFVAADVSRLKQIQLELEKTNNNLQTTQSQLIQASKLASIGELSAGVAHELNQPLMVIRNGGQMLERRHKKGTLDEDKIKKYIESVLTNSKRMMKIIDHLRTFSRRSSTEFSAIDVNKVIHDSFFMVNEQLRLHDITVNMETSDIALHVNGEPNQLEQVVLNLIGNARDAMDSAGLKSKQLTISTQLSENDDQYAEILVSDNGNGIPEDAAKQIFDPFFTTKEEGKGTGLGLSISYGIIAAHQGEIDIAHTSIAGTTMRIRLPIIEIKG